MKMGDIAAFAVDVGITPKTTWRYIVVTKDPGRASVGAIAQANKEMIDTVSELRVWQIERIEGDVLIQPDLLDG